MAWLSGWSKRIKLDIDYTNKIGASVTGRRVIIFLKSGNGETTNVFTEIGANKQKMAITQSDGTTQLYAEIELWDTGTPLGIIHVSKSDWTISADTYIYLYYDSTHADNTDYIGITPGSAPATNVWKSDIIARYGMNDAAGSGWVSPTSYEDPDSKWTNEENAYDDDTGTSTYNNNSPDYYLELHLSSAINCNKVRIYAETWHSISENSYNPDLAIDVYYDSDWHNIFDGTITKDTWVEKEIGSSQSVSKARIKWNTLGSLYYARLFEFDFFSPEIVDSTSNKNDGIKKGTDEPIEATGQVGEGQDFEASSSQYISVSDVANLRLTSALTISYLCKLESINANQILISKNTGSEYTGYQGPYILMDNTIKGRLAYGANYDTVSSDTLTDTTGLHHLLFTWDKTQNSGKGKIFLDGTEVSYNTQDALTNDIATNTIDLFIGRFANDDDYHFDGIMDEVFIANAMFSDAEAKMESNNCFDSLLTYNNEETPVSGNPWRYYNEMSMGASQ